MYSPCQAYQTWFFLFAHAYTVTPTCNNSERADMTWVQKAKPGFSLDPAYGLLDGDWPSFSSDTLGKPSQECHPGTPGTNETSAKNTNVKDSFSSESPVRLTYLRFILTKWTLSYKPECKWYIWIHLTTLFVSFIGFQAFQSKCQLN